MARRIPIPRGIQTLSVSRMASVHRVGEWNKLLPLARRMRGFTPKVNAILFAEAKNMEQRLKGRLRSGAYASQWVPLSEDWRRTKARRKLDPRMMIAHGDYIGAIKVLPQGPAIWTVGINRAATNRRGESLVAIGYAHEYGHPPFNLPERPHWRPEYQESARNIAVAVYALARLVLKA